MYLIIFILLLPILEIFFRRTRLGDGFICVNGLIFKNFIFMSLTKSAKQEFKKCGKVGKSKTFLKMLNQAYELLEPGVVYRTRTHGIIKRRIERKEKEDNLKILKCKKTIRKPLLIEKLQINNNYDLFDTKQFYYIEFIKNF